MFRPKLVFDTFSNLESGLIYETYKTKKFDDRTTRRLVSLQQLNKKIISFFTGNTTDQRFLFSMIINWPTLP